MRSKLLYPPIFLALLLFAACITPKKGPRKKLAAVESANQSFDAIIVPGIPFDVLNNGWDSVMKARVIWSWVLYKNGIAKNIIYSGSAVYSPFVEAKVMGIYAQKLGIPEKHIFYDTLARHSTENVYYSYLLAKKLGFKSLALATDPFQSFLLKGYLKKRFGTPVQQLPFVVDTLRVYQHLSPRINPVPAYRESFISITDSENIWQRLRGTMGGDIDWDKHEDGKLPAL